MEKRISKGVLSAALILVTSFVCGIIAIAGFLLGDFQAVLYSAVLENVRSVYNCYNDRCHPAADRGYL